MKRFALALFLSVIFLGGNAMSETLVSVQKMTEAELAKYKAAVAEVNKAERNLAAVKKEIGAAHGLTAQSWMEWSTRVAFDGDFILKYYTNHMDGFRLEVK